MNQTGISQFNQARIEWAIRLRYSPMPELEMDKLATQLNSLRIGELRVIGKTWEVMMERDGELAVNSDKRKSDASGLEWQIVSDGSNDGDKHAAALQYFYDNLITSKALDQDATGGVDELVYQTLSALDYYYSAHEMLLRVDNPAAKEVTAEFRHTPIWFFESRRGYLGYLKHIFDMYGQPCKSGEWLTAVNVGWMRQLCIGYFAKWTSLTDWLVFCRRYGSGFLVGQTDATKDSQEWTDAAEALAALANDGSVLTNKGVDLKFLDQQAKNQIPMQPVVEYIDRLYAKCYRGVDLATGSRGSGAAHNSGGAGGSRNPVGSSVQKEESGIFLVRDSKWVTGTFNERVDRPIIRYLFNQEPRAWFVLVPPLDDMSDQDLESLKTLVPMGFRVMLKEVYKRFRWSVPEAGEPCLQASAARMQNAEGGMQNEDEENEEGTPNSDSARPAPQPRLEKEKRDPNAEPTQPARTDDNTPIGAGADPKRNPGLVSPQNSAYRQSASRQMPDTQVDGGALFSRAALAPRSPDGQTLPMPSLGYAIPNDYVEQLSDLTLRGMGGTRAAKALKRHIDTLHRDATALANDKELQTNSKRLLIEAILTEFEQINKRLAAIAEITDPETQRQKLAQVMADLDALEKNLNADPATANAIYKILVAGIGNGIETGAKETERALANAFNPNQRRDSLGRWVDENGGGLSQDENIQRGQRAMDRAIRNKADVQRAMYRKEVGQIDFVYGTPGEKSKDYAGGFGVSHIVAKHGEEDARAMPEVLAKGKITPNPRDPETKKLVTYENYEAALAQENTRRAWLLSGFRKRGAR